MPYKNPEDKKKRIQERRKKWLEDGLCTICGKEPLISGRCYGLTCKQKMLDRRKRYYESDLNISRKKSREAAQKRLTKCLEQGVCYCCNMPIDGGKRCQLCKEKEKESRNALTQTRFAKGLCIKCGKCEFVADRNKWCKNCYLKHMSRIYLGNKTQGKLLEELLDKQEGFCPYTGFSLVLGKNTSLDHICARSCGGDCNIITNLQWVYSGEDFCINMMKRHYSHDSFIKAVKAVAAHLTEGGNRHGI